MPAVLPFQNPARLRATQLPVPERDKTPRALAPLTLSASEPLAPELLGYRALYGLDQLTHLTHDQGYVRAGEHRIHVQVFRPQVETIRGTVWLIHGYLEHSALYQPMIAELLAQQFSVITFDLPGHGLSNGPAASIRWRVAAVSLTACRW